MAAVLGGAQSLHTNSFDEALSLPSEEAAALALRTQQVLAHETGVADSADPLGGSFLVERLTSDLEAAARALLAEIDAAGGVLAALESGYFHRAIAKAAYAYQRAVETGEIEVVGVNRFARAGGEARGAGRGARDTGSDARPAGAPDASPASATNPAPRDAARQEAAQTARLAAWRAARDASRTAAALERLGAAAAGPENVVPPIIEAVRAGATLGEISDRLRLAFGTFREKAAF
jgi:methylmalonyl-CoA mutase N-terminal domain/subunit